MARDCAGIYRKSKGAGRMNHKQIKTALRTRLAATPSAPPIVWGENAPGVYERRRCNTSRRIRLIGWRILPPRRLSVSACPRQA